MKKVFFFYLILLSFTHELSKKVKRQPTQLRISWRFSFYFFTILESDTLPFNGSFDFGLIGSPKYFFKKSFIIIISIL